MGARVGQLFHAVGMAKTTWEVVRLLEKANLPHVTLLNSADRVTLKTVSVFSLKNPDQFRPG
jgi:hypothetical protein